MVMYRQAFLNFCCQICVLYTRLIAVSSLQLLYQPGALEHLIAEAENAEDGQNKWAFKEQMSLSVTRVALTVSDS